MRKLLIGCLVILSLVSAGCSRRTMGEADRLNVLCYEYQTREIQDAYWKAYADDDTIPKINFISPDEDFSNTGELYDQLIKGLLTKSPDVDLYMMSSYEENLSTVLRNHYYVDLSGNEALNAYFSDMYPQIRDWCTEGEELFGFPFYVYYSTHIMVNPDMMKTVGYTVDDIRTVSGLIDFCGVWRKEKSSPPNGGRPIAPTWYYYNYLLLHFDRDTGELDLDTPEFRGILTQCRDMLAHEDLFKKSFTAITDVDSDASPLYFDSVSIISRETQYEPIPYPLLDAEESDAKRYSEITWLIVNPYGKHVDQVTACLTALAGAMGKTDMHGPIYRDAAYYAEQKGYSQDRLDALDGFLSHMEVGRAFPGYGKIVSLCDEYVYDGSKTLDEVIAEAQHTLDMMRQEQYIGQ